jgi:hypothetical protein
LLQHPVKRAAGAEGRARRRLVAREVSAMFRPRLLVMACCGVLAVFGVAPAPGQPAPDKLLVLNVSNGQLPSDTGQDDKTFPQIVDNVPEIGAKALKIAFAKGDSFGGKVGAGKNWKRFAQLRFDAVNPAKTPVKLELAVDHGRTKNFRTRVAAPITLKPGRNAVAIGTDEMTNTNGSAPDLANVIRWFILDVDGKAPTVYFGDIYLEGGEAPAPHAGGGGAGPLVGYHIKGRVGTLDVDLTVTPFPLPAALGGGTPAKAHGDPARLERIKAAKMPKLAKPVSFDTPEADAIVSALEVYPPDNPWNLVVSDWPLHPNSKNIIASIGANKPMRYNPDMGYVLVPPDQTKVDVKVVGYPGESDKGPAPVPDNVPIEGWPVHYHGKKDITLDDVQADKLKENGDRHALVVDPVNRMLYEFYQLKKVGGGWQAAQTSIFDLKSNKLRPDGWTSADAAGLPIFPSVVRYDELKRGKVEHAMRVTVVKTRRAYVYPATHYASPHKDENLPRMGERIRLRKDFDVTSFSAEVQTILKGLQTYGMFVADNGIDWAISVAPDPRIPVLHDELRKVKGSDFEVVQPPPGYQAPGS